MEDTMNGTFGPVIKFCWVVLFLCLAAFAVMYVLDQKGIDWVGPYWWLIFAFPVFLFDIIFLPAMYSSQKKYDEGVTEFNKGKYLTRWDYSENEWAAFVAGDWRKTKKRTIIASVLLTALFILIMAAAGNFSSGQMISISLGAVFFISLIDAFVLGYAHSVHRAYAAGPRQVTIGKNGVSIGKIYTAWDTFASALSSVKINRKYEVPLTEFAIRTSGGVGSSPTPLSVPIPRGKENEAEEICRQFNAS
jgi:hypothetical protein